MICEIAQQEKYVDIAATTHKSVNLSRCKIGGCSKNEFMELTSSGFGFK